jgi:hypothetical protein
MADIARMEDLRDPMDLRPPGVHLNDLVITGHA